MRLWINLVINLIEKKKFWKNKKYHNRYIIKLKIVLKV